MTADNNPEEGIKPGNAGSPVRDRIVAAARSTPLRMPAGGWLAEVTTNENWRTTTIVRRHRDRAATTPGS